MTQKGTDTFIRPDQAGLGEASDGQDWNLVGGPATPSIVSNRGHLGGFNNYTIYRIGDGTSANIDGEVSFNLGPNALNGAGLAWRVADLSNGYRAITFDNSIYVNRFVSGVQSTVASTFIGFSNADELRVRVQHLDDQLKVKLWKLTDPEPDWQIEVIENTISAAGYYGIISDLFSGAGNGEVEYWDLSITDGASGADYVIDVTGDASTSEVVSTGISTSVGESASSQDMLTLLWSLALSGSQTAAGQSSGDLGLAGLGSATTAEAWSQAFVVVSIDQASATEQVTHLLAFTLTGQASASDSIDFTPISAAPANITLIAPAGTITLIVPSGYITLIESEANMDLPTNSITSVDDYSPIAVGDTGQPLIAQFWRWNQALTPPAFEPINLASLDIDLIMVDADGNEKVCAGPWTKTDAAHGLAEYGWQDADLDTKGTWTLYFRLRNAGKPFHLRKRTLVIEYAPV